ncbi:MAG: hypothetical protein F6K65_37765 [Moorea sp. SIO3C2]|nr:hypothetical protein [Moorena sp. SIO3C2]
MSTIIATTITTTPADVGWAVQQTNQLSSPSHPKALPTNCPPQPILKLARCQFYAPTSISCPPQHLLKLARCQFYQYASSCRQTNQISSPCLSKALPTNCPPQPILKLARCQFYQDTHSTIAQLE